MKLGRICCCHFHLILLLGQLLLPALVSSKKHGNPANDIVDIINVNRTALKLPALNNSPGLGCMALQYAEECRDNCTGSNTLNCQLPEDDFTEVLAANCGVELPTFSTISGQIAWCESNHLKPSESFSRALILDKKSPYLLRNRTHTEVGVGLLRTHKGHFLWCVLFSSGQKNSSFVLEDLGQGIKQKEGCFSGTNISCSGAHKMMNGAVLWYSITLLVFAIALLEFIFDARITS
ncbi:hypothetical protein Nepgr_019030 [Nepenthes gracilis]|uniref:Uncharacterized protein n=1 Tax=Nepenthes gracilis TaxID=150966 RepID=A0AAD3XUL5_NEPGR|nr:hypothetical protein Nepgr_019030 [Nepenthes gracilis]